MLLEVVAHTGQRRRLAVAHAEQVVAPGEQEQLAEGDLLAVVDVPRGGDHREQTVTVALDLRAVMFVAGIGDRQLGQVEGVAHQVELLFARHTQPEPPEPGATSLDRQLLDRIGLERAAPIDVPGGVDDHDAMLAYGRRHHRRAVAGARSADPVRRRRLLVGVTQ